MKMGKYPLLTNIKKMLSLDDTTRRRKTSRNIT